MAITKDAFVAALLESIDGARRVEQPYRHWFLQRCLPADAVDPILDLPFPAPDLGGVSGKRELHNATRKYFDAENRAKFPVCEGFCQAFQDKRVTDKIARPLRLQARAAPICASSTARTPTASGSSRTPTSASRCSPCCSTCRRTRSTATLGTDIYDKDKKHVGSSPFAPNAAMVFVPSGITYHGFEAAQDRRRAQVA